LDFDPRPKAKKEDLFGREKEPKKLEEATTYASITVVTGRRRTRTKPANSKNQAEFSQHVKTVEAARYLQHGRNPHQKNKSLGHRSTA
jgi:hypothetical protein